MPFDGLSEGLSRAAASTPAKGVQRFTASMQSKVQSMAELKPLQKLVIPRKCTLFKGLAHHV